MTRVLVDANIVLDVLLRRTQWLQDSVRVWSACGSGRVEGFVAAHAATTVHYMIRGGKAHPETMAAMESVMRVFRIATVDEAAIRAALLTGARDFEDEVSAAAALACNCSHIVTRDPRGFRNSPVPAISPDDPFPEKDLRALQVEGNREGSRVPCDNSPRLVEPEFPPRPIK